MEKENGEKVIKTLKKKRMKIVIINSKFDYTKVKLNSFSWVLFNSQTIPILN